MINYKKSFLILMVLMVLIVGLQAISASDVNETSDLGGSDNDFKIDFDVESVDYGENVSVGVNVPLDADGDVNLSVRGGNQIVYSRVQKATDGSSLFNVPDLNGGTYTVAAYLFNDSKYTNRIFYKNNAFDVNPIDTSITAVCKPVYVGENATVIVTLDKRCSDEVWVNLNGNMQSADIVDGVAVLSYSDLLSGVYTAYVEYYGDGNFNEASTSVIVNVSKISDYNINISYPVDIAASDDIVIDFSLPGDINDNITVRYDNKTYIIETVNGSASLSVDNIVKGNHLINVSYAGNAKYSSKNNIASIYAVPWDVNLSVVNPVVIRPDNFTFTITRNASGNLTVFIDNQRLTVPVRDGDIILSSSSIRPGNYTAVLSYSGDDKYASYNMTANLVVISRVILKVDNLVKYYSDPERFVVGVSNSEGEVLSNYAVNIFLNGVSYTRISDVNGTVSMAVGLRSGVYPVVVSAGNAEENRTITILATVNASDVVKVFRNATQYYATFRYSNGSYLAPDSEVEFNINGVIYKRNVTGNGLSKLSLNLKQGSYVLTATNPFSGEMCSNNITVLATIIENRNLVKYQRNDSQYVVQLVGSDGNVVGAGETVLFNINGVFYNRTTNSSGYAKLNINLEPGNYIITGMYHDCQVSNSIKVLPVLIGDDVYKRYGGSESYQVLLLDGSGRPVSGAGIVLNINGVFYTRTTGSDGVAVLNLNLQKGVYIITAYYNEFKCSNRITIT